MSVVKALTVLCLSCLLSVLFYAPSVGATPYCPSLPEPKEEGDPWYIPESAFTRDAANEALRALQAQVNRKWDGDDWLPVENKLKMIKGYLYRVYLDGYKKEFHEDDKVLIEEFCKFLRDEGFVSH